MHLPKFHPRHLKNPERLQAPGGVPSGASADFPIGQNYDGVDPLNMAHNPAVGGSVGTSRSVTDPPTCRCDPSKMLAESHVACSTQACCTHVIPADV